MRLKIILPLLILLSLSIIVILPSSLGICIPDGCSFSSGSCGNDVCINETIGQHLSERAQLLNVTPGSFTSVLAMVMLVLFFIARKNLTGEKIIITQSYIKQKFLNSCGAKLFNYFIEVFSSGILHPKIYQTAN